MRITVRAAGIALGLVLLAMPALAGSVAAHELPQSSSPSPGSSLAVAPAVVTITFGETPDAKLSSIKVLNEIGVSVTAGPTAVGPGDPKSGSARSTLGAALSPRLPGSKPGTPPAFGSGRS